MVESVSATVAQSQGAQDAGKPPDSGRWCCSSQRHFIFVVLVLTVVLFFYNTNVKEMVPGWNPTKWGLKSNGQRQSLVPPKQRGPVASTPGSKPTEIGLAAPPQTETSSKAAAAASKAEAQTATPYKSPGPYLVEYPSEYHFVINEPKTCERQKPFLVLMVPVAPDNRADRDVIRSTWGSERAALGNAVALFFLMGLHGGEGVGPRPGPGWTDGPLLQESLEHRDLIQSDFLDSYKNLTIKTMVMLEWLDAHCPGASYAMKVDTDMFLNVPKLVGMLANAPRTNYMTGLVQGHAAVHRYRTSKWFLPVEIYPSAFYPRYPLGMGYVLSLDLPRKLVEASRHVKAIYIEDVYLGMCMSHLGIDPTDPPNWNYFQLEPREYSRCAYSQLVVTTTQPFVDRVSVWKDFKRPGQYC
ncbi:beta-1,3-galactosyltransferase 1-like [Cyclopterus lumpus]|uniref:Hexosyltransferase n=1 Tax=Cyclopterus lumpus TaxID=8103 RepID=A0A8C2WJT0_CYCLU|nr:beta-1,3-galactosyltransferase 1-like [Cyclopterus lumpus]